MCTISQTSTQRHEKGVIEESSRRHLASQIYLHSGFNQTCLQTSSGLRNIKISTRNGTVDKCIGSNIRIINIQLMSISGTLH